MSRTKAEIRMATAHDIGVRMDDMLEGARAELERLRGARLALSDAASKLEAHLRAVDRDVDRGELDVEQATIVKRYVDQCGGIVRNLATSAEAQILVAQGKTAGLEQSVQEIKRRHDVAHAKLEAFERGDLVEDSNDETGARAVGEHPGDPLEQRRTEARSSRRRRNNKGTTDGPDA